jgi:hypothetical protein
MGGLAGGDAIGKGIHFSQKIKDDPIDACGVGRPYKKRAAGALGETADGDSVHLPSNTYRFCYGHRIALFDFG